MRSLTGNIHVEALQKHGMYMFKGLRPAKVEISSGNGGGRFGKDCILRNVTEEMLAFLQITDVAKEVFE